MVVTGNYSVDQNFIEIIAGEKPNRVYYTIARNTGEWGSRSEGSIAWCGGVLDSEWFDEQEAKMADIGTFELQEEES